MIIEWVALKAFCLGVFITLYFNRNKKKKVPCFEIKEFR
jgi:hypothetical protein